MTKERYAKRSIERRHDPRFQDLSVVARELLRELEDMGFAGSRQVLSGKEIAVERLHRRFQHVKLSPDGEDVSEKDIASALQELKESADGDRPPLVVEIKGGGIWLSDLPRVAGLFALDGDPPKKFEHIWRPHRERVKERHDRYRQSIERRKAARRDGFEDRDGSVPPGWNEPGGKGE